MLQSSIQKYHNKILTAAEAIDELIKPSKEIVATDHESRRMGLSDFEYAFYTAVAMTAPGNSCNRISCGIGRGADGNDPEKGLYRLDDKGKRQSQIESGGKA